MARRAGDLLTPRSGLTAFTPQMAAQGIQLVPSAATSQVAPIPQMSAGNSLFGGPNQPATFADLGRQQRMEGVPRPQAAPLITPEDVRERNPFNPQQMLVPEDDALTPPGSLAPSEMKGIGGLFTKLGDILANPAAQKALAAIGMHISPWNTGLGEFAMETAEATAQQQFQQGLERGEKAGDLLVPGLSAQGRQSVLAQHEGRQAAVREEERRVAQDARLERQEKRTERLTELEVGRIEQQLAKGEIDQERANLELSALRKAEEMAATTGNPNHIIKEAARVLGINVPESINLESLSKNDAMALVGELASLSRVRENIRGGKASGTAILSEGMREVKVKALGSRLSMLKQQLTAGRVTSDMLRQIGEVEDQILALGGDPLAFDAATGDELGSLREQAKRKFKLSDEEVSGMSEEQLRSLMTGEPLPKRPGFFQRAFGRGGK